MKTRAALRDALLVLIEQKPFDQITIRDITAEAGAGYATFFRHYETKLSLLNDLAEGQISTLIKLSWPVLRASDARPAARALCCYVDEHRKLWSVLLTGGAAGTMREEFIRQAAALIAQTNEVAAAGLRAGWLPPDLSVIFGVCSTVEILAWWLRKGPEVTAEQVAEILDRLVISPTVAGTR